MPGEELKFCAHRGAGILRQYKNWKSVPGEELVFLSQERSQLIPGKDSINRKRAQCQDSLDVHSPVPEEKVPSARRVDVHSPVPIKKVLNARMV